MQPRHLQIENIKELINTLPSANNAFKELIGNRDVNLEFWVLKHKEGDGWVLKLVYGLVSLSKPVTGSNWRPSDFNSFYDSDVIDKSLKKPQVAKLSITIKGDQGTEFIKRFFDGEAIGVISTSMGLPTVPSDFSELKLGIRTQPKSEFVFRPPVIAMPENIVRVLSENIRGITSPLKDTVSIVATLFRMDKGLIWKTTNNEFLPGTKELLKGLADYLLSQTGLAFHKSDFKRLGNIEWIVYPSKNSQEQSLCEIKPVTQVRNPRTGEVLTGEAVKQSAGSVITSQTIEVKILDGAFSSVAELIVQCSAFNSNDVISDQSLVGTFPGVKEFTFQFSEPISSGAVKIYKKEVGEAVWSLWHQEYFDTWRQLQITTRFNDLNIPRSPWLSELLSAAGSKPEINHFKPNAYLALSDAREENFPFDPWHPVNEKMIRLNWKVSPSESRANFIFPSGKSDEDRVSEISEWLLEACKFHGAQTCLIFDPFFDVLGVDVLLKANTQDTELIAITNTQCRSYDDSDNKEGMEPSRWDNVKQWLSDRIQNMPLFRNLFSKKELINNPSRDERIKKHCEENEGALRNRGIRIFDLHSTSGSSNQLFHDRYVLFWDKNGQLIAGYNFSNSIQGAMVDYPLLITPIPDDIFDPVQNYIYKEFKKYIGTPFREIVTLYSPPDIQRKQKVFQSKKGLEAISQPGKLFSVLLSDLINAEMPLAQIEELLKTKEVLIEGNGFNLSASVLDLSKTLTMISSMSFDDFKDFWKDFSEFLARTHGVDGFYLEAKNSAGFKKHLREFILNESLSFEAIDIEESELEPFRNYLSKIKATTDFTSFLSAARDYQKFGIRGVPLSGTYSLSIAISAALAIDQSLLVEAFVKILNKEKWTKTDLFLMGKLLENMSYLLAHKSPESFLMALCDSNVVFLKTLVIPSLFQNELPLDLLKAFQPFLKHFSNEELILIYSEWINGLQGRANWKGGRNPAEDQALRKSLVEEILSRFPSNDNVFLKLILAHCDGTIWGNWSILNYQEIGLELVKLGKCSVEDLALLWIDPLIEKIRNFAKDEYYFNFQVDAQFTEVAVHLLLSVSEEKRQEHFKNITKIHEGILKQLGRPRIESTNPSLWYHHIRALVWLQVFLRCLLLYKEFDSSAKGRSEIEATYLKGDTFLSSVSDLRTLCFGDLYAWFEQSKK